MKLLMTKRLSWIKNDRRRDMVMALGVGWAFLGIPAALLATKIDGTLGWIVLAIVTAPLLFMGIAITAFIALAPFFARKPIERIVAAPMCFLVGYALLGWTAAAVYLAAVLTTWAVVEVRGSSKSVNKFNLPI